MMLPVRPARPVPAAAWASLQAWCVEGAGAAGAPFWRPGALPAIHRRFAVAQWAGPDDVAEAWALALDGSDRLGALAGRADRLLLRLRTKWDDARWWRHREAQDPWDAGHLIDSDDALRRLQQDFTPRRATLLTAGAMDTSRLAGSIDALQRRSANFRHPVRLLCLAGAVLPPSTAVPVTCLTTADYLAAHLAL